MMPEQKKPGIDFSVIIAKAKGALINFIIPLISILITGVLAIFYIYPSFKSFPVKKQDLEKKIETKNILNTKVLSLNKLIDFQQSLDENLDIVNKVLVPEPEVPKLLDQATQLAQKAGLSLDRLSYSYSSKGATGGGFDAVTVSMGGKSSFNQLILFMELVENAARYVSVPNFRYSVSAQAKDGGDVSSTFSLDSPYLFVQSSAVTDDPIKIDITSSKFIEFMSVLKGLDYYDFLNANIQAEEKAPEPEPEPTPVEEPAVEAIPAQ